MPTPQKAIPIAPVAKNDFTLKRQPPAYLQNIESSRSSHNHELVKNHISKLADQITQPNAAVASHH